MRAPDKTKGSAGGRPLSDSTQQSQRNRTTSPQPPQRRRVVVGDPLTWRRGYPSEMAANAVADRLREIGLMARAEVER